MVADVFPGNLPIDLVTSRYPRAAQSEIRDWVVSSIHNP